MKYVRWSALAIFLLFFGMAMLEAFQSRNWIKAAFWLATGAMFFFAGGRKAGTVIGKRG